MKKLICQNCGREFTPQRGSESKNLCPKCFIKKLDSLAKKNPADPSNDPVADDEPMTDPGTGQQDQPTTPTPGGSTPGTPSGPTTPKPTPPGPSPTTPPTTPPTEKPEKPEEKKPGGGQPAGGGMPGGTPPATPTA